MRKRAATETWRGRVATLDREAAEQAERAVVRDRAERIAHTIRLVDQARERFEHELADPDFTLSASGFVDLVKLEQLLEGGPTERHAVGVDGLLSRLRVAVNGGELERAIDAGDLQAARRPSSWAERFAVRYANDALRAGAEPMAVLAVLEAARSEIDDWTALEARYGISETLKLWGDGLLTASDEKVPAAIRLADLSGTPIVASAQLQAAREAADPIFNLYGRGMNPNFGQPIGA